MSDAAVAEFIENEAADARSQKLSNRVRIKRWPGEFTVVGPPVAMVDVDRAAECLYGSGFMRGWIQEKIKEHLLAGGTFVNHDDGPQDYEEAVVPNGQQLYLRVRSEYRMATELEVLNWVDTVQFSASTGRAISKRAQERGYVLHYHEDVRRIAAYGGLPRQAKVILDVLSEAGREEFTEASIQVVLTTPEVIDRLKTKQDPMTVFAFYRKRLVDEEHLEEVGADD